MSRGPRDYVAAALELLDEVGPADPGPGMSMTSMTVASGLSRSSVYRHWASVQELNEDLTRHAVVDVVGWQRRILDTPVERPLADAVADAMAGGDRIGAWARTALAGWEPDHPLRVAGAAWEAAWLERFEAWLDAHLAHHGLACRIGGTHLLAVSVASLVEGRLLLDQVWSRPEGEQWYTGRTVDVRASIERFLVVMTEPSTTTDRPAPVRTDEAWRAPLPTMGFAGAKARALAAASTASAESVSGAAPVLVPGRLVDTARLARRLGASERRLYEVWPTASDVNADLITAIGDRQMASFDRVSTETLTIGFDDHDYGDFTTLKVSAMQAYVETATSPGRIHTFQCTQALRDPAVLDAFIATTLSTAPSIRTIFMSYVAMGGRRRLPGVSVDTYLGEMRAIVGGIQRLAKLHPVLLAESVPYRGEPHALCGFVGSLVLDSMTTDEPPPPVADPRSAPPLGRSDGPTTR